MRNLHSARVEEARRLQHDAPPPQGLAVLFQRKRCDGARSSGYGARTRTLIGRSVVHHTIADDSIPRRSPAVGETMSSTPRVLIVGAGLTGCTLAHAVAREGVESVLLERAAVPGGLIRSELMHGVIYEPHGSHIFHTEDREVWELANAMTPFRRYRHRVDIVVQGKLLNWPPLLSDVERLQDGPRIKRELLARRERPLDPELQAQSANFEDWCLELMGPDLYELFVRPYTEKQWGRPARDLPARFAPRRVSVRWDDDPYLFPDSYQGWPAGPRGYTDLIEGLLGDPRIELRTDEDVTLATIGRYLRELEPDGIVLTCPLDAFTGAPFGSLDWRGILVKSVYIPHLEYAQGAMVVNYPAPEYPFIRIHETKHASGQQCEGTVLGFEFTGAATRYYPIESEQNRMLNASYQRYLTDSLTPNPVYFAGRLANYMYINMDDCMRQALDCAANVLAGLRESSRLAGPS
jgi:UDP-galactopyranose mutase